MKYQKLVASGLCLLASSNLSFAESHTVEHKGKALFDKLCVSCHVTSGKPTVAPPLFGVINHVKTAHPAKPDFVNYIVEWTANPQADKALMPGAVKKFGLMPKLPYKAEEVRLIAEYLYDTKIELPAWYREHYKAKHGHEPKQ